MALHTLYTPHKHSIHTPHTAHTYPIRTPYVRHTYPIHILYALHTHPIDTPYTSHTHPIHTPYTPDTHSIFSYFASSDRPLLYRKIFRPANVFEHPEMLKSLNGARGTQARELATKLESSSPIINPFPAQRVSGASASRAVVSVSISNSSDCSEKVGGRRIEEWLLRKGNNSYFIECMLQQT